MKYSNIDYTNDVKVLGRVVSITMDNKVAEAEQVFDTPFKYNETSDYNIDEDKTGLSQYEINRLLKRKVWLMDNAGLVPEDENATIEITNPVDFKNTVKVVNLEASGEIETKDLKVTDSAEIKDAVISDLEVLHTINTNNINVALDLTVGGRTTLNELTVNGFSTFNKLATFNDGIHVHGLVKFFDNVEIDGSLKIGQLGDLVTYLRNLEQRINEQINALGLRVTNLENAISNINSKISQLESKINQLEQTITNVQNNMPGEPDLSNYYTKNQLYTKEQIDQLINQITPGEINCLWVESNGKLVPVTNGIDVATSGKFYSGI